MSELSDMWDRDSLYDLIYDAISPNAEVWAGDYHKAVDAILAAGWRGPLTSEEKELADEYWKQNIKPTPRELAVIENHIGNKPLPGWNYPLSEEEE